MLISCIDFAVVSTIKFKIKGNRENKFPINKVIGGKKDLFFLQRKTLKVFYALFCPFGGVYVVCVFLIYVEKNK